MEVMCETIARADVAVEPSRREMTVMRGEAVEAAPEVVERGWGAMKQTKGREKDCKVLAAAAAEVSVSYHAVNRDAIP